MLVMVARCKTKELAILEDLIRLYYEYLDLFGLTAKLRHIIHLHIVSNAFAHVMTCCTDFAVYGLAIAWAHDRS